MALSSLRRLERFSMPCTTRSARKSSTRPTPNQLQKPRVMSVLSVHSSAWMPRKQHTTDAASAAPKRMTHSTDLTAEVLRTRRCAIRNSAASRNSAGYCENRMVRRFMEAFLFSSLVLLRGCRARGGGIDPRGRRRSCRPRPSGCRAGRPWRCRPRCADPQRACSRPL